MSTTTLDAASLKGVKLDQLKEAAESLDLPVYGNKLDVASRLQANKKGGKSMLKKLITSARKDKPTKTIQKDAKAATAAPTKAAFLKKERARLIAAGATDKAKIDAECKRLWDLKHNKTSGDKIITESKLLDEATRKARGLVLCGADSSGGKTVFKYKLAGGKAKAPVQRKKLETNVAKKGKDKDEVSDDESDDDWTRTTTSSSRWPRPASTARRSRSASGSRHELGLRRRHQGWSLKHAKEEPDPCSAPLTMRTTRTTTTTTTKSDDDDESRRASPCLAHTLPHRRMRGRETKPTRVCGTDARLKPVSRDARTGSGESVLKFLLNTTPTRAFTPRPLAGARGPPVEINFERSLPVPHTCSHTANSATRASERRVRQPRSTTSCPQPLAPPHRNRLSLTSSHRPPPPRLLHHRGDDGDDWGRPPHARPGALNA